MRAPAAGALAAPRPRPDIRPVIMLTGPPSGAVTEAAAYRQSCDGELQRRQTDRPFRAHALAQEGSSSGSPAHARAS
jgi:hypothetical protein